MTKQQPDTKDILHVFSQYQPHDNVTFYATRTALEKLQKAINKLISSPRDSIQEVVENLECADGEMFNLEVKMIPEKVLNDTTNFPYTADPWGNKGK